MNTSEWRWAYHIHKHHIQHIYNSTNVRLILVKSIKSTRRLYLRYGIKRGRVRCYHMGTWASTCASAYYYLLLERINERAFLHHAVVKFY